MGTVAGCTVHLPLFIKGKNVRNLYLTGRDNTYLMLPVVIYRLTGIYGRPVMAGVTHLGSSDEGFFREGCDFSASLFEEKGLDPAVVAQCTLFGRIGLERCGGSYGMGG
jgi:hypothetical protein